MKALLSLAILVVFSSCKGQNSSLATNNFVNDAVVKGDTVKALGNNIMIVYQDKKNNYWFGSWEDGLYRYDGKIILHFTTKDGLSDNRIDEIQEDRFGNMYFNTSGGINKFDGKKFTTLRPSINILNEWKLEPDDLWFRCPLHLGHVYRYDGEVLHSLTFPKNALEQKYYTMFPSTPISPYLVYTIYRDTKGNVWFGTGALGVCRFDGKTVGWIQEDDVTEIHNGPANGVRSIIEDKDGYFWFNTMYRYDVYGKSVYQKGTTDKQGFNYSREKGIGPLDGREDSGLNEYLSITKDDNDELWIATYRAGAWRYDGKKITHYAVKDGSKDITLFSVYKDNYGNLWLGTHESGAYKFNGKTFEKFKP